ncbi:MAG: beta-galactosidase, partial [Gemmatimonadales bacterium]
MVENPEIAPGVSAHCSPETWKDSGDGLAVRSRSWYYVTYISIAPQWGTRAASPLHCLAAHLFVPALRGVIIAVVALACLSGALAAAEPEPLPVADFDGTWQQARWSFSNGPEFPGAQGAFGRSEEAAQGRFCGRLAFDFSGGGNYVAALLDMPEAMDVCAVRVHVLTPAGHGLTFRYTDQTGQTLQRGFWAPAGRWVDVTIPVSGWNIHWGGANDGIVHGPPQRLAFLIENTGWQKGALLIDDIRVIPGKPGEGAGMAESEYVAAAFDPDEGWWLRAHGAPGRSRLGGRTLTWDFSQGADAVGIVPGEFSLLGDPQELRMRVRGAAPGHPVRLQIATHFMTFEKSVGEFVAAADGVSEVRVQAPPGEGWRWFGGENDGKRHGPLRLRGIYLDAGGRPDSGTLELLDIRVRTRCAPDRTCLLTAAFDDREAAFIATVRTVQEEEVAGTLRYVLRDWGEEVLAEGDVPVAIPAAGRPAVVGVPLPEGAREFVEAELVLEAPGQLMPSVKPCYTKPVEPQLDRALVPASPFGMGLYLYRYPNNPEGLRNMARAAGIGAAAGVKWTREEFHWSRIEPREGEYDWSFYDALVETAERNGI